MVVTSSPVKDGRLPHHFAFQNLLALSGSLLFLALTTRAEETVPEAHHPDIESISLFAANPDIVTPIGIAVARDGRVFVQENHTHKRKKDYVGPTAIFSRPLPPIKSFPQIARPRPAAPRWTPMSPNES